MSQADRWAMSVFPDSNLAQHLQRKAQVTLVLENLVDLE